MDQWEWWAILEMLERRGFVRTVDRSALILMGREIRTCEILPSDRSIHRAPLCLHLEKD
jgi:hypothetical protein